MGQDGCRIKQIVSRLGFGLINQALDEMVNSGMLACSDGVRHATKHARAKWLGIDVGSVVRYTTLEAKDGTAVFSLTGTVAGFDDPGRVFLHVTNDRGGYTTPALISKLEVKR